MASHNLDKQPDELLVSEIASLRRQLSGLRTLQLQSSQALRVEVITGYQYLTVPSSTNVPNWTYIDIESPNPNDIMIASMMRSTFMRYTDTTFNNADLQDHGLTDDFSNVWMSYDGRPSPDDQTLAYAPSGTLEDRIVALLADTSLPYYKARIGLRVNRITTTAKPANLDQYLVVYQIRATIG